MAAHRWRAIDVEERGGRRIAVVLDQDTRRPLRVYFRLGKWRRYTDDSGITDPALKATARRALLRRLPPTEPAGASAILELDAPWVDGDE